MVGTAPARLGSGLKNSIQIIVPGADQDGSGEIERHGIPSLHEEIVSGTHALQGSADSSAANDHRGRHLGGHCRWSPNPKPKPKLNWGSGFWRREEKRRGSGWNWCSGHGCVEEPLVCSLLVPIIWILLFVLATHFCLCFICLGFGPFRWPNLLA